MLFYNNYHMTNKVNKKNIVIRSWKRIRNYSAKRTMVTTVAASCSYHWIVYTQSVIATTKSYSI